MAEHDLEAAARAYLDAFEARDLDKCLAFYADDARLFFQMVAFQGRPAIENWHAQRFEANLQVARLDSLTVKGNTATIDANVTSNTLKAWRLPSLNATVSLVFENGKIKEAKFGPRLRP